MPGRQGGPHVGLAAGNGAFSCVLIAVSGFFPRSPESPEANHLRPPGP